MTTTMTPAAQRELLLFCLMLSPDVEHAANIEDKYSLKQLEYNLLSGPEAVWPHLTDPGRVLVEFLGGLDGNAAQELLDHFPDANQVKIKTVKDDRAIVAPDSSAANRDELESVEMKNVGGVWYIDASTAEASVEIGGELYKMEVRNDGLGVDTRDDYSASPKSDLGPKISIPEQPVQGTIMGRPFEPDKATYNGAWLEFRSGADFFPDAAVKVFLFLNDGSPAEKSFLVRGGNEFGSPHVHLSAKREGDSGMSSFELVTVGYYLSLEFRKEENGEIPGRIFLQIPGERGAQFAGTFRATVDARDASAP
ncbi:MAG: hypothetical protein WKF77_16310 [Planctomycetaceae bacterium]